MEEDRIVWKKRIGYVYYQLQSLFSSQRELAKNYDTLAVSIHNSPLILEQNAQPRDYSFPAEIFSELADYSFEGETFKGLKDYDTYLRLFYGDYMQLPPEDQRENRHQIVEIDFGEE